MWVRRRRLLMVLTLLPMVSLLWLAGLDTGQEPAAEALAGSGDLSATAAVDGGGGRMDHLVAITFAAVDSVVQRREAVVKDKDEPSLVAVTPALSAEPSSSPSAASSTSSAPSTAIDEEAQDVRAEAEAAARELAAWAAVLAADLHSGGAGLSALAGLPWQAFLPSGAASAMSAPPRAPLPRMDELVTVYMIALGDVPCASSHLEIALWSLYAKGEWKGRTVVVTDAPACIRLDRVIQGLGSGLTALPGPVDLHVIPAPTAVPQSAIAYKLWKLRAFEVVAAPGTPYVLYLDVDAFVRSPLDGFLRTGMEALHQTMQLPASSSSSSTAPPPSPLPPASALAALCAPVGASPATYNAYGLGLQRERCHSGVMLLHRDVSSGCLARWQQTLVDGQYERDQLALDHVLNNATGCRAAALVPREWITYPNTTTLDAYDLDVARHTTFLHITRTYRMRELRRLRVHISRALDVPLAVAEDKPVTEATSANATPSFAPSITEAPAAPSAPGSGPPITEATPS